jgi:hypothetical protein
MHQIAKEESQSERVNKKALLLIKQELIVKQFWEFWGSNLPRLEIF